MARYDDNTVASVLEDTQRILDGVKKSDSISNPPEGADLSKVGWYNGIPFHPELLNLITKLKAEIPSIEFGAERHTAGQVIDIGNGNMLRVICEAHAYLPNDIYAMGVIGYGDFTITRNRSNTPRPNTYMVKSRNIENAKYDEYREQNSMYMSKDIDKIVTLAKKHLRPYAPYEIIKRASGKVADNLNTIVYKSRNDARNSAGKLINDNVVTELKHLLDTGYNFLDSSVRDVVVDAVTKYELHKSLKDKKVAGKYVIVSNQLGVQMFDVFPYDDATYSPSDDWRGENGMRYRAEEVPDDIMGKVAVLAMTQAEDYIEGVGNRIGETTFWLQDEA